MDDDEDEGEDEGDDDDEGDNDGEGDDVVENVDRGEENDITMTGNARTQRMFRTRMKMRVEWMRM